MELELDLKAVFTFKFKSAINMDEVFNLQHLTSIERCQSELDLIQTLSVAKLGDSVSWLLHPPKGGHWN
jgi:hypothetical protein